MAQSALAGLLAALLLVSVTLSASHSFHQLVHRDAATSSHLCLICSLAKGHVSAAEVAPLFAALVAGLLFCVPFLTAALPVASDRRLASTRAPPRSSSTF